MLERIHQRRARLCARPQPPEGLLVEQLQRYIPELFGGRRVKSIASHTLLAFMADLGIHDRGLLAILEVSATDAVQ